jgi:hypothetical protein
MLLSINAQWFIKKNDLSKLMNYPNPGKRSLPEKQSTFVKTDCSIPYSQLHLYQQKMAWIITGNVPNKNRFFRGPNIFVF